MATIENYRTVQAHDPYIEPDVEQGAPAHPLDSPDAEARLRKLREWYEAEREKQSINRFQQALDEDFYDHLQWSEEDAQELMARGQAPLVFNLIKPTIDWITGTEKRTRIDGKVLPREEDDVDQAESKTKVMKYVDDVNKGQFARSRAFTDTVKVGVGWLEDSVNTDPMGERLLSRQESWRNVLYDSNALERDLSDARYLFRWKWVDLDIAQAAYPDRHDELRQAAVASDLYGSDQDEDFWYIGQHFQSRDAAGAVMGRRTFISDTFMVNNRRARVRLIESWYRMPTKIDVCVGGEFDGYPFDPTNFDMAGALATGQMNIKKTFAMQMRCAIFTEGHLVWDGRSPYRHNRFPLTPIWAYRRGRDNAPYGAIRGLRDPQEDFNKRASKALYILSTNRVIMDKGAVDDVEELREEVARPDSVVVKNPNKELKIEQDKQLADEHLKLMEIDKMLIQETGGVNSENLGRQTNATSGKAILARQDQGGVITTELFDNYRYALQLQGEIRLSLIEQYYTDKKVVRILGNRGKIEWLRINEQDPVTGEIKNDITARTADFVIGDQDFRQSLRIAMFEAMGLVVAKLPPELSIQLLDLWFELGDLPVDEKKEMVARIRRINGQVDPDQKLTPEDQTAMGQAKKEQQMQKVLAVKGLQLDLAQKAALVRKTNAEAQRALNELQGNPQNNEMRTKLEEQVRAIRDKAAQSIMRLQQQLAETQVAAKDRAAEIDIKARTDKEVAAIKAGADVEIARIQATSEQTVTAMNDQIAALMTQIGEAIATQGKQTHEAIEAQGEATKEAIAEIAGSVHEVTEAVHDVVDDADQQVKTVEIQTDKDGNVTGATIMPKTTGKRPRKKDKRE